MPRIDDPIEPGRIQEILQKNVYVTLDECEEWKEMSEGGMDNKEITDTTNRPIGTVRHHVNGHCNHAKEQ